MLIIEERPEKSFLTFLLRHSQGAEGTDQAGATSGVNLCSVLERVVATWISVNILSFKQTISAWVWKALSFQREIFLHFIALILVLYSNILLCIPRYHRFWQLFLLFSLESCFEHHSMSYLPSLPQYFVFTVSFHTLLSSYKIRPSIRLIIPGSEVSKTWNKTTKCSPAFPEGSDDMHVHTAAQAFWPFRRGCKEMSFFSTSGSCCMMLLRGRLERSPQGFSEVSNFGWRPCPLMASMLITGSHLVQFVQLYCS